MDKRLSNLFQLNFYKKKTQWKNRTPQQKGEQEPVPRTTQKPGAETSSHCEPDPGMLENILLRTREPVAGTSSQTSMGMNATLQKCNQVENLRSLMEINGTNIDRQGTTVVSKLRDFFIVADPDKQEMTNDQATPAAANRSDTPINRAPSISSRMQLLLKLSKEEIGRNEDMSIGMVKMFSQENLADQARVIYTDNEERQNVDEVTSQPDVDMISEDTRQESKMINSEADHNFYLTPPATPEQSVAMWNIQPVENKIYDETNKVTADNDPDKQEMTNDQATPAAANRSDTPLNRPPSISSRMQLLLKLSKEEYFDKNMVNNSDDVGEVSMDITCTISGQNEDDSGGVDPDMSIGMVKMFSQENLADQARVIYTDNEERQNVDEVTSQPDVDMISEDTRQESKMINSEADHNFYLTPPATPEQSVAMWNIQPVENKIYDETNEVTADNGSNVAEGASYSEAKGASYSEAEGASYSEAKGATYSEAKGATYSEAKGASYSEAEGASYCEAKGATYSEAKDALYSEAEAASYSEAEEKFEEACVTFDIVWENHVYDYVTPPTTPPTVDYSESDSFVEFMRGVHVRPHSSLIEFDYTTGTVMWDMFLKPGNLAMLSREQLDDALAVQLRACRLLLAEVKERNKLRKEFFDIKKSDSFCSFNELSTKSLLTAERSYDFTLKCFNNTI